MVQDDVTELVVEIVNVLDILERGRLRKNIVLTERQGVAADTIIIVPQQKILCFGFIFDGKAAWTKNLDLLIYRFEVFVCREKSPL